MCDESFSGEGMTRDEFVRRVERVGRVKPEGEPAVALADLLDELGKTPDEIVEHLLEEDCHGPRQNDCFCPVAIYLSKRTGHAASATMHMASLGEFTYNGGGRIESFIGHQWARTPAPVAEVIERFDHGEFPELAE